jgi:hypothetical protein
MMIRAFALLHIRSHVGRFTQYHVLLIVKVKIGYACFVEQSPHRLDFGTMGRLSS